MPLIILLIAAVLTFLDKPFDSKLITSFNVDEAFSAVVKDLEHITPKNRRGKVKFKGGDKFLISKISKISGS